MSVESQKLKAAIIDEIKEKLEKAQSAVIIDYMTGKDEKTGEVKGVTVEEATAMRKQLRDANVDYSVYKNTLIAKAIEGTKYEGLKDVLSGPSALAVSYDDAIAPARVLAGVMKQMNKMNFKAGVVEGILYDEKGCKALASIPSRNELIAKFMGSIQSPVGKMVRTFQAIADSKAE